MAAWGYDPAGNLQPPTGLDDVIDIDAGAYFSAALRADGTVIAWGDDEWDQLGVPENLDRVVDISVGASHGLALRDDGTVALWGGDDPGGRPQLPRGLDAVAAISSGSSHDLFLHSDGTVTGWSHHGDAAVAPPAGLDDVVAVAAGTMHSLALRADGTVVAWGRDLDGSTDVPAGLADVVAISAGQRHSLALRADGTVVAWGDDSDGQSSPPEALTGVTAISAGSFHNLAVDGRADADPPGTYEWTGLLPPLRDDMVVRSGRTLPVRFALTGSSAGAQDVNATLWYAPVEGGGPGERVAARGTPASGDNRFRHRGDHHSFLWSTKGMEAGRYRLIVDLADDVERFVEVTVASHGSGASAPRRTEPARKTRPAGHVTPSLAVGTGFSALLADEYTSP